CRVRESPSYPRQAGQTAPPPTRRIARATLCASLRDRWTPPRRRPRPRERAEAAARARERIQSRPLDANALRGWHATRPSGPLGPIRDHRGRVVGPHTRRDRPAMASVLPPDAIESFSEMSFLIVRENDHLYHGLLA